MLDQTDLTGIYKTFQASAAEYVFFSAPYKTFSRIHQAAGYKTNST